MKITKWLITIVALIPALALGGSEEQQYEEMINKNMSGWKGIVFICSFDSSEKLLEKICHRAITDIELLAASNNVELKVAEANDFFRASIIALTNEFVTLEYDLMATQGSHRRQATCDLLQCT